MRLVTSLTLVEEQLKRTVVVALIMGAAVLAFTIMSGLYFVRSIVVPLGQVERTAAGIAGVSWMFVCPSPATSGMRWTACAAPSTGWPRASKRRKR